MVTGHRRAQTKGCNWKGIYFCEEAIKLAFKHPHLPAPASPYLPPSPIVAVLSGRPASVAWSPASGLVARAETCAARESPGCGVWGGRFPVFLHHCEGAPGPVPGESLLRRSHRPYGRFWYKPALKNNNGKIIIINNNSNSICIELSHSRQPPAPAPGFSRAMTAGLFEGWWAMGPPTCFWGSDAVSLNAPPWGEQPGCWRGHTRHHLVEPGRSVLAQRHLGPGRSGSPPRPPLGSQPAFPAPVEFSPPKPR